MPWSGAIVPSSGLDFPFVSGAALSSGSDQSKQVIPQCIFPAIFNWIQQEPAYGAGKPVLHRGYTELTRMTGHGVERLKRLCSDEVISGEIEEMSEA